MNGSRKASLVVLAAVVTAGGALMAQSPLAQLGLTETAARNYVLGEIKSPASGRISGIAIAGTRAFFKLPPATRASAASALFAWAKAYVNSAPFKTAYAEHRRNVGADSTPETLTIDEEVKKRVDEELARVEQMKQQTASLPPETAAKLLETVKELERNLRAPGTAKAYRMQVEAAHAESRRLVDSLAESLPADPQKLLARRLHEFLDATAGVNFSAKTISLTGGADGIEFIDPADRKRSWMWQEAVIAGPDATRAARAAAEAWLKEIER